MSQAQVAAAAGGCRSVVSDIERGQLEDTTLRTVRRVGSAVGVTLPFDPHWRGVELVKLLDERHAALVGVVAERLAARGWLSVPEHTFNEWGERGSIDVFAWHAARRAVLCVEVKTRLVDLQDLLSTEDRKRRLAPALARKLGWTPLVVGSVVVLPEETWARNAVGRYAATCAAKFPMRMTQIRRWLKDPASDAAGIWLLVNEAPGDTERRFGASMRVRPPRKTIEGSHPRSGGSQAATLGGLAGVAPAARDT